MRLLRADVFTAPRPRITADGGDLIIGLGAVVALAAGAVALLVNAPTAAAVATGSAALSILAYRRSRQLTMTDGELQRLRDAEQALSVVSDAGAAARLLASATADLLMARRVVVVIEGVGDTVRADAGPEADAMVDVTGDNSRMRLLHHSGTSYGSLAASGRVDNRRYGSRHDHILDALAERASITMSQLDLHSSIAAERQTLADLIGSSSDGIFSVSTNGSITSWNPAMASIAGVSAEIALGAAMGDVFNPTHEDGSTWAGPRTRRFEPDDADAELLSVDTGDELRWISCSYARLSGGGYVVIARDVTERKKLLDDKDGWIAQVSHELRTPLTPIKGFIQTLMRRHDILSDDERTKILEVMLREEQRLEELVDALLESSQLSDSTPPVARDATDWVEIVEQQAELHRTQHPPREIEVEVLDPIPTAYIDRHLAISVLANLLSNARKFSSGAVEVTVAADGGEIVTSVIDHGEGIARSDRERIFDRFTRLGNHLTRRQQGVGLGLHLARRSIERMDGRIWADETPGGGATFRFTLPASPPR